MIDFTKSWVSKVNIIFDLNTNVSYPSRMFILSFLFFPDKYVFKYWRLRTYYNLREFEKAKSQIYWHQSIIGIL